LGANLETTGLGPTTSDLIYSGHPRSLLITGAPSEEDSLGETSGADKLRSQQDRGLASPVGVSVIGPEVGPTGPASRDI